MKLIPPSVPAVALPVLRPSKYAHGFPKEKYPGAVSVIPIAPTSLSCTIIEYLPVCPASWLAKLNLKPTCSTLLAFQLAGWMFPSNCAPLQSSNPGLGSC